MALLAQPKLTSQNAEDIVLGTKTTSVKLMKVPVMETEPILHKLASQRQPMSS